MLFFRPLLFCLALLALGVGCTGPTVNLETPKPIEMDIRMRLDVYQYSDKKDEGSTQSAGVDNPEVEPQLPPPSNPSARRRNRMADIQKFKNERLVGEGRDGLVVIVNPPEGEYGDYVRKTVSAENVDRLELMKDQAEARKTSLPEIQKEQAELWKNRSFAGELLEVEVSPEQWEWKPKG